MRERIGARVMPGTSSTLSPRYWLGALGLIATALFCAFAAPLAQAIGLPNGRVYEQVSPVKKNGNPAGAFGFGLVYLGLADASGNRVMFGVLGASENASRGLQTVAVSDRSADGWHMFDPMPYPAGQISYTDYLPFASQFSDDLSRVSVNYSGGGLFPGNPVTGVEVGGAHQEAAAIYINDAKAKKMWWVTEPKIASPKPAVGAMKKVEYYVPAGHSPDFSTFYFSYTGTLVAEDASRTPNVIENPVGSSVSPRGLYRWHEGELINYGSLPNGSFDPYGAVQAGGVPTREDYNVASPANFNGQVSGDGTQAVFVSPDPGAGSGRVPEVYVRRGNGASKLVSKSELTGLPSESGPFGIQPPVYNGGGGQLSYAYGSEDGSHVYFESKDALTADAPVSATEKAYVFDVATEDLVYLAGVRGEPIAATPDLSSFVFSRMANGGANKGRVGIWTGGVATTFAESPSPKFVNDGRVSADGKVFIFGTDLAIPGFNNGGFLEQVYRYDITTAQLECISCPPEDVSPESNAQSSHYETGEPGVEPNGKLDANRGMSADGNRVFFDTGDPLVKQDANGQRDVYMWENGKVSLISTGRSGRESYFIDNSESGNDVFFTTTEGISPADTDGSYDIYDARVGGGFTVAGPPSPCAGDCQAPETVPSFTNAGSTELNGAGNVNQRGKKPKCAKGKVRKQGKCVKKQGNAHKRAAKAKQGSGK